MATCTSAFPLVRPGAPLRRLNTELALSVDTTALQVLRGLIASVLLVTTATVAGAQASPGAPRPESSAGRQGFLTPPDSAGQPAESRDSLADSARLATGVGGPRMAALTAGINSVDNGSTASVGDTGVKRTKAVEYSEGYYKRLAIHRYASYAELPLFAAEFILGQKLLNDERNGGTAPSGIKTAHTTVAVGLGALFAVNTVTGVWNLLEARHDPNGRTRRTIHGIGMLIADGMFVWTASLAGDAKRSDAAADRHRNAAIASISVATLSTVMMWLWKD
jgi:hypothetical protein